MLKSIRIENADAHIKLNVPLNRINIFIGHEGCGKSVILEEILKILPESHVLDGFCPLNQLQQRTHEILLNVSSTWRSEREKYEEEHTVVETEYDYDPITGEPKSPEGRQVVKKPGFEGPFSEWNEESAFNLTIARCQDVLQSIAAIDYSEFGDCKNYALFMRNGIAIPWNELSRGQMQTIQMLYEINLGKSQEIIMNRAESACHPVILGQIAHNILVSPKQYFIVTDTVLLNQLFDLHLHEVMSDFLKRDLFAEINLYIVYIELGDAGIGTESRIKTVCLTGEQLRKFAERKDLYDGLSKFYKY